MPAMATVFDKKCNPLLELGTGPFNTIRWNPKGKFLCLAGFGNLPGDMAFWDYVEKRQLGTTKAECSVTSEWSPDGRYFMTATTAPRLQVDNGIKIFHHNGSLYFKKMFDKLYQADWKPKSPDKFGEIAELVKSVDSLKIETTKTQGQGSKSSQVSSKPTHANPPTQKPAAYRPPHAKAAAAVQAQLFGGSPSGELSKNALKNKKKREKQREKKAAEETRSKLAAAIESNKQQLQWFCDACKGIPQVVHPAFPFNNQVHVAPATAPPTSEDMELAMAIDASLQSSLQQRPPHLGTHPGSGADASTSRTNSECGTVHCGSSNLGPDSPQKGSNSGYNGQETSTNGVFQHSHIQTDSVVQSTPQNLVPASIPSAPPVADSVVDDGPIHYPSINASPLEFYSPPLEIVDASPEERKDSSTSSFCVICLDAPIEGACIPCGHMAGCFSCLSEIKAKTWGCPVCRAKIDQVVRLYAV